MSERENTQTVYKASRITIVLIILVNNGHSGFNVRGRIGHNGCTLNWFIEQLISLLTWTSTAQLRVLSVFHFSVKVTPYSEHLYLVSMLPDT